MRLIENRAVAWLVLGVCAVGSVFGLGGAKLNAQYQKVNAVYYDGTETSLSVRHSMDAYLDRAADRALVLAEEAMRILGEDNGDATLLASLAASLEKEEAGRADCYADCARQVERVYTALLSAEGDIADAKYAYSDFKSAANLIKNDAYAAMARAFNEDADGFPASLIARLFGINNFETYGG